MIRYKLFGLIISFIILTIAVTAQDITVRFGQLEIGLPSPYSVASTVANEVTIELDNEPATLSVRTAPTEDVYPYTLVEVMNASRAEPLDYTKISVGGVPALVSDAESNSVQMVATWQGIAYDLLLSPVSGTNPVVDITGSAWDTIFAGLEFVAEDDTPYFSEFTTNISGVNSVPLDISVTWEVMNRPENSNLEFVQILSNGEVINVELPRDNPFISSAGAGTVRLATTANEDIVDLQARLINLDTEEIMTVSQIILPSTITPVVVPTPVPVSASPVPTSVSGTATSSDTGSEVITQFSSSVDLTEQTTTVTWTIAAEAVDIVRYQAVGASGQAVIENLPAEISGTYTFEGDFQAPEGDNAALYSIATLSTIISGSQSVASTTISFADATTRPQITVFNTTEADAEVNALPAQINITWEVINRPPETNLEFVQVLSEDVLINAELPRPDPFIASSGSGVVNLIGAANFDLTQAFDLTLRARLVDGAGNVITSQDIAVPFVPSS